ncbi:FISUMP domain-containing protein [Fibrobacter sp.]
MKMRKLAALQLAVLFSALYLAACSNSDSLDISRDGSGDSAESNDSLPSDDGYLVDARDGQRYRTVTIGGYTWMAENLNYETDSSSCYDDSAAYCEKFGRLYRWMDASDSSICPAGWHLPSWDDYDRLVSSVGGINGAGKVLRSVDGWAQVKKNTRGTDEYGFSVLPAGAGYWDIYHHIDSIAMFWTTERRYVEFFGDLNDVRFEAEAATDELNYMSIRCIKEPPAAIEVLPPCRADTVDNCIYGFLTDWRDGQVYRTVKIGNQWWMAENLNYGVRVKNCCDGDSCYKHGKIYDIFRSSENVCPNGWRLPTIQEFDTLFARTGGVAVAGLTLGAKNTFGIGRTAGKDSYGFSAVWLDESEWSRKFWANGSRCTFVLRDTSAVMACHAEYPYQVEGAIRCIRDLSLDVDDENLLPDSTLSELPCEGTYIIEDRWCNIEGVDNCEYDSLTDARDGQVYRTVKIGDQWWMAENLNFRYLQQTRNLDSSSFCMYDSLEYCEKYGRLYLWSAAMDSAGLYSTGAKGCGVGAKCSAAYPVQGVCPDGWHLPSWDEWYVLDSIAQPRWIWEHPDSRLIPHTARMLMTSVSEWWPDSTGYWEGYLVVGKNSLGFDAYLAGFREGEPGINSHWRFCASGNCVAAFWSSTPEVSSLERSAFCEGINDVGMHPRGDALSVRCIKD